MRFSKRMMGLDDELPEGSTTSSAAHNAFQCPCGSSSQTLAGRVGCQTGRLGHRACKSDGIPAWGRATSSGVQISHEDQRARGVAVVEKGGIQSPASNVGTHLHGFIDVAPAASQHHHCYRGFCLDGVFDSLCKPGLDVTRLQGAALVCRHVERGLSLLLDVGRWAGQAGWRSPGHAFVVRHVQHAANGLIC